MLYRKKHIAGSLSVPHSFETKLYFMLLLNCHKIIFMNKCCFCFCTLLCRLFRSILSSRNIHKQVQLEYYFSDELLLGFIENMNVHCGYFSEPTTDAC